MITLSLLLGVSLFLNGILFWYARRLTRQFVFFADNIIKLESTLGVFAKHLGDVHELEMFYGDETLGALIRHSKDVMGEVKEFYESFYVEADEDDEDEEDDDPYGDI